MLKFIDLYNDITGQPWSMFDGDVEAADEFEKSVTTSIQKALNHLWNSYDFPFKEKTLHIKTKTGVAAYNTPAGDIIKKTVKGKVYYSVKCNNKFLHRMLDYETAEEQSGKPEYFYLKNEKIYLYPTPDDNYKIEVDYNSIFAAKTFNGISKATLENEDDYIDIPAKYEQLFKSALLPLAMKYLIASPSDENYPDYKQQYEDAYKILIKHTTGIDIDKTIGWR